MTYAYQYTTTCDNCETVLDASGERQGKDTYYLSLAVEKVYGGSNSQAATATSKSKHFCDRNCLVHYLDLTTQNDTAQLGELLEDDHATVDTTIASPFE